MTTPLPTIAPMTIMILKTNGTHETYTVPAKEGIRMGVLHKLLGFDTLDVVRIGKLQGSDLVMVVNDNGYVTRTVEHGRNQFELKPVVARFPINSEATKYYHAICRPGTTHQIVGDVAIFHDDDVKG